MSRVLNDEAERTASAVILHGVIHRSLRHVVESLRKNVIAPLARLGPVDVFFHSWDVAEIHNPRGGENGVAVDSAEVARLLPEARGIFESQEEFDRTVDWERMFERNPMRHCTGSEKAARATLMNFRRALESQERAWRFFEENKTRNYGRVVATRADLRFFEELRTSNIERSTSNVEGKRNGNTGTPAHRNTEATTQIWVPRFHSWGGVNDRFAIGNEEAIRIWSNRGAFADGWLLKAGGESSEWLLMKWLERNRVRVGFLDFTFQRIRANGEVTEMDREIRRTSNIERSTSNVEVTQRSLREGGTERFLILAREAGAAAESLRKVLEPLGKVEVIVDRGGTSNVEHSTSNIEGEEKRGWSGDGEPLTSTLIERRYIWVPDEEAAGYEGLMGRLDVLPAVTAWSRAMVHLSRTLEEDEAVWFVEDDVAGDAGTFAELVEMTRAAGADLSARDIRTKEEDPGWYFWTRADGFFGEPCRAFQPLCRVTGRLLRAVLDFRKKHRGFIFHEILFASLAQERGMRMLDWNREPDGRKWFSAFQDRPDVRPIERGISHPVKDPLVHGAVCGFADVSACERAAFYEGGNSAGWFLDDFGRWKRMFVTDQAVRILETGVSDGVGANVLLDEVFLNPQSEVHGIDSYDGGAGEQARGSFEANAERGCHAGQLHLYEGTSREVLAWMIAGEGFWESFDFIHLNGADDAREMLSDVCQAWDLLKPGGILILGGYDRGNVDSPVTRPGTGADAFLSIFGDRVDRLFDGARVAVMKRW